MSLTPRSISLVWIKLESHEPKPNLWGDERCVCRIWTSSSKRVSRKDPRHLNKRSRVSQNHSNLWTLWGDWVSQFTQGIRCHDDHGLSIVWLPHEGVRQEGIYPNTWFSFYSCLLGLLTNENMSHIYRLMEGRWTATYGRYKRIRTAPPMGVTRGNV